MRVATLIDVNINQTKGRSKMGTRSRIVLDRADNFKVNNLMSMYVHYDGYLEYNGKMLLQHYDNSKKLEDLIVHVGGYASALKDTPEQTREESVHRESIEYHFSEEELMDWCDNSDIEFVYLLRNNVWYVSRRNSAIIEDRYQGSYYYYWTKFVRLADQEEVRSKPDLKVVQ